MERYSKKTKNTDDTDRTDLHGFCIRVIRVIRVLFHIKPAANNGFFISIYELSLLADLAVFNLVNL